MNSIQLCKKVLTDGAMLIRPRKGASPLQYDAKELFTGKKKGWAILDAFTAGAIVACYNAVQPKTQAAMEKTSITKLASICFKYVR